MPIPSTGCVLDHAKFCRFRWFGGPETDDRRHQEDCHLHAVIQIATEATTPMGGPSRPHHLPDHQILRDTRWCRSLPCLFRQTIAKQMHRRRGPFMVCLSDSTNPSLGDVPGVSASISRGMKSRRADRGACDSDLRRSTSDASLQQPQDPSANSAAIEVGPARRVSPCRGHRRRIPPSVMS